MIVSYETPQLEEFSLCILQERATQAPLAEERDWPNRAHSANASEGQATGRREGGREGGRESA